MRKRSIGLLAVMVLLAMFSTGCMELMPKEKQTFRTRGKGEYQGFAYVAEDYTPAQPAKDGCVVYKNTKLVSGREHWDAFAEKAKNKEPGKVRIMRQFGLGGEYFLTDVIYDGENYRFVVSTDPTEHDYEFKYMFDLEGTMNTAVRPTRYVVLTNEKELTFEDVWKSEHAHTDKERIPYKQVIHEAE